MIKKFVIGTMAALMLASAASAADVSVSTGYLDSDQYVVSAGVSKQISNRFDVDVTGRAYFPESRADYQKVEVGVTGHEGPFSVRAAVGGLFQEDGRDLPFYSVTPAVEFTVPYTDKFQVFANYENSFNQSGYETYGVGAVASWNVLGAKVSAGVASNYGDAEYVEYTVGVSKAF